jgi:serine phosphatase RsbU (regulator of sigma subunit)/PAS domain-containing protein
VTEPSGTDVARLAAVIARQRQELDRARSEAATRSVIDLARGMLMEQLHCPPAEAAGQLSRLAVQAGESEADLAARITRQASPEPAEDPGLPPLSVTWAAVDAALDGTAVAAALLDEALSPVGAAAVALWLVEPDGGLELAGQAGFGEREASRWRRIHPDMAALPRNVTRDGTEIWWPAGRPVRDSRPLIGGWPGGARAVLPLRAAGKTLGCMAVCWPEPLAGFPPSLRRQLAALADLAAQALGDLGARIPAGAQSARHRASWIFGLLDGLLDGYIFVRAVRGADGEVADFRIDHVGNGFRDPAGRRDVELTGRPMLEIYPDAALSGGLFDACVEALLTGEPQSLSWGAVAAQAGSGAAPVTVARIVALYDGVVIAWRAADEADRLASLLQHAQRLGRIGGWEESLVTGEVHWTQPAFALFGQEPGEPVPLADLHSRVPADDVPAVQGFRNTLLAERKESAAAFRIVRPDDGSVRQMRAYAEPVTDPRGSLIAIRGAYQDVSADYHTRLAFAATREQLADTEERAEEEHRLAMRLQQAITPRSSEPVAAAGLDVTARYRPAGPGSLVSGDWYDTVLLPSKEVLVVVGDIAGHGLDAVTGMVAVRNGLRGLSITGAGPATLLSWLNGAACHFTDGIVGTAVCGLYDPISRSLRWARAGHLPPILVHDGAARMLSLPQGLLLGADPDASYAEITTPLQLGDTLLLFTDGLIERRDRSIDDALDSLLQIASRPVGDIGSYADRIVSEAASDTDDDACLVVVHVR